MAPTLRRRINGMVAEDMGEKKEAKKSADDDTDPTTDDNDDDGHKEGDVVDGNDHDLKKERAVAKQEEAKKASSLKTGVDTSSANAKDADASEKATPEDAAATFHYYVFALLFMIGFMMHCRKYYTINCRVVMLHITAYILCPIPGTESATPIKNKIREFIFASFLLFCIWTWYDESPFNANHHNVCGIISLLLAPSQLQRAWFGPTSKRSVTTTANALNHVRCAIVIMYFMAGFHKINEDFIFHPRVSCAYDMLWDYLEFFGIYEREDLDDMPLYLKAMPYLGLVIELVPPIMLCFRSTQMYGVLLLVKLHWMLLPVGFADFGSIAQSFLFLFVAANRATEALPHHLWGQMGGYLVFFEAVTLFLWFQDPKRGTSRSDVPLPSEEAAIVFSTYAIIWWNLLRVRGLSPGIPIRLPKSSISLAALAAFIFFAMNPYLGLRTVGTLAMFSNLRTEGPTSNHLLLRSNPLKIWNYQEDVVYVIDCASNFKEIKKRMLYQKIAFDRVMIDEKEHMEEDVYLKVLYKDVVYETQDLNNDPTFDIFRQEESWFSSKYLDFRDIQPQGPQKCVW